MDISNIDDMLMGGKTAQQPATPENQYQDTPAEIEEDTPDTGSDPYGLDDTTEPEDDHESATQESRDEDDSREDDHKKSYDEYGNETENLSESMKKRLQRQAESMKRKHDAEVAALRAQISQLTPQQQQQVQQAARDFEHDPEAAGNWQQQLDAYIEQTVQNMQIKKQREAQEAQEREIQAQFEEKLLTGMDRFTDFRDTIAALPCEITNPMTIATRSLDDPAGFLYAAAKRHPEELQRISQLRDPYAQIREMGKLEERMRKGKATTQAPRPLGRAKEDANVPAPKQKKEESIEDLIAKHDAKKLANIRGRQGYRGR